MLKKLMNLHLPRFDELKVDETKYIMVRLALCG